MGMSCAQNSTSNNSSAITSLNHLVSDSLTLGCERTDVYIPWLKDKRVGLLVNHTSLVKDRHLVDTLLRLGVDIKTIFAPEHGFRGVVDAGKKVVGGVDAKTGIPIVSLYGSQKKPSMQQLEGLDWVIFDVQDVGVRFYTYISSLHYLMEACAENNVGVIVLDRPNPNGDYVDGPVLDLKFRSFVGMHPIPIVHGLTVGELALMINGMGWLDNGVKCRLSVVEMLGYNHQLMYVPPVKPSPNLPNYRSIRLYPSLCLFEATQMSVGRGTEFPFQVVGYPDEKMGDFTFTPVAIEGMDLAPLHQNKVCYGVDLRDMDKVPSFTLQYFFDFYHRWGNQTPFVNRISFFNLLAGTDELLKQIEQGWTEERIRQSWKPNIDRFLEMRSNYLLYKP